MRSSSIVKVVLLGLLALVLLVIMVFGLIDGSSIFYINTKKVELYNEEFSTQEVNRVDVSLVSTDVIFKSSSDDKIKVTVNGSDDKKDKYSIMVKDGTLIVNESKKSEIHLFFLNLAEDNVTIYLPNKDFENIKVDNTSGDVSLLEKVNSVVSLKTVSGDILVAESRKIVAESTSGDVTIKGGEIVNVKTVSGEIEINSADSVEAESTSGDIDIESTGNINIESTSGDVSIDRVNIVEDSYIRTISGDVTIDKINDVFVETETKSGDVKIGMNNRQADKELKIKTTSGDIRVG